MDSKAGGLMEPFRDCTRFMSCNVNNCPLHLMYPELHTEHDDQEPRCTLPKSYRIKVAENYKGVLKYGGLTSREHSAKMTWESKTPEERAQIVERGKKSLVSVHYTNNIESTCVSVAQEL